MRTVLDEITDANVRRWHDDGTDRLLGLDRAHFDAEHWGLFVWLRTLGAEGHDRQPYALRLVACSTHAHRDGWSQTPDIEVRQDTRYPVATAVYWGDAKRALLPDELGDRWRSMLAMPLELRRDRETCDFLPLGGVTLNGTRYYHQPDEVQDLVRARAGGRDVAKLDMPSLLSVLPANDVQKLQRAITAGVLACLDPAGIRPPVSP